MARMHNAGVRLGAGVIGLVLTVLFFAAGSLQAADWPTYRHDNSRSGVTEEHLSTPLAEEWVFEPTHPPDPAWGKPTQWVPEGGFPSEGPRLRFDEVYHVAATEDAVYFGSSSENKLYCLDASTGRIRWSCFAGGPIRLAPTVSEGKVYFGSDDGAAYCLDAGDGSLIWKRSACPRRRRVLGNGHLISLWPVRTGVLVRDGVAYFGAGVFPAEDLYLCAVDAEDGSLRWKNDAYGAGGKGTVSPQGHLLASSERLFVPSGRATPAAFDLDSGRFLYQPRLNWRSEGLFGGTFTVLAGDHLYNGTRQIIGYDRKNGKEGAAWLHARRVTFGKDAIYLADGSQIRAVDRAKYPGVTQKQQSVRHKERSLTMLERDIRSTRGELERAKKAAERERKQAAEREGEIQTLIAETGGKWLYTTKYPKKDPPQDSGGNPWHLPDYDDEDWKSGKSPFGYGDGDRAEYGTKLPDNGGDYFLRTSFRLDKLPDGDILLFRIASDNAAKVYLNGNLVDDDPLFGQKHGHEFSYWNRKVEADASLLRKGENVVAVHLSNLHPTSDAYFDLGLLAGGKKLVAKEQSRTVKTLEKKLEKLEGRADRMRQDIAAQRKEIQKAAEEHTRWKADSKCSESLILAGDTVFAGGEDTVVALDAGSGKELWTGEVKGSSGGLAVAGGRLLVSTDTGRIHCFVSGEKGAGRRVKPPVAEDPYDDGGDWCEQVAEDVGKDSGVTKGYCLILGGDGRLALELARRTDLQIYVAEPDAAEAERARERLDAAGVYGARVCVDQRALSDLRYPRYFANLIVYQEAVGSNRLSMEPTELASRLKPLGGVAYVGCPPGAPAEGESVSVRSLSGWLQGLQNGEFRVEMKGERWARVERGALAGAEGWTHQFGDAGNTLCSGDRRVKTPLGVLWFGEPGPRKAADRHSNAPDPLSANGRFFIQGAEKVRAYDAYNGLHLWSRDLPVKLQNRQWGLGTHRGETGNMAASDEALFVVAGETCYHLAAATGETERKFGVPEGADDGSRRWGYVAYHDGLLLGTSTERGRTTDRLFAYDVASGELTWTYRASRVQHHTIAAGDGRVYLVAQAELAKEQRQNAVGRDAVSGKENNRDVRLVVALNAATGETVWQEAVDLTGCIGVSKGAGPLMTIYSEGVLVICGQYANGHHWGEFFGGAFGPRRLVALGADDGRLLWSKSAGYRIRPLIVNGAVYAEPWAYDLKTGEPRMRAHPLTGREARWQMARPGHHCGWLTASTWCLFFRSASAAYYGLQRDYGTAHFGAIRPGCGNNCIPANGLMVMPEASSGCVCPFAVQCSVALEPRSQERGWGVFSAPGPVTPVKRLAVNFGAPGDRRDGAGRLWLGYPRPYGFQLVLRPAMNVQVASGGDYYRENADDIDVENAADDWIFTSGCRGLRKCTVKLRGEGDKPAKYTVRLFFAEPEVSESGRRVFDVKIQGNVVAEDFDVCSEAGGRQAALIREFDGVEVDGKLEVELIPGAESPSREQLPVISGIEVVRE